MSVALIVVKPLELLPGCFTQLRYPRQASRSRDYAAIYTHMTAIIATFHTPSSVTYLSERDHKGTTEAGKELVLPEIRQKLAILG